MNLFRKIFAKKIKVLPLYLKQAEYIKAASAVLVRMMQTTDKDEWFNCENKIKSYEVQADDLLTLIYEELNEGRLMAVSRSDLQTIAMTADDFMDKVQRHRSIFSLKPRHFTIFDSPWQRPRARRGTRSVNTAIAVLTDLGI